MKDYLIFFFSMLPFATAMSQLPVSHFSGLIGYFFGIFAFGAAMFIKHEIDSRALEKVRNSTVKEKIKCMVFYAPIINRKK